MVKYDYLVFRADNWKQLNKKLDEAGAEGFRLFQLIRTSTGQSHQVVMERMTNL